MAIISVQEDWKTRTGSQTENGGREYSRHWIVVTDGTEEQLAVELAVPVRWHYSRYPLDAAAIVTSIKATNENEIQTVWRVEVEYSTLESKQSQDKKNDKGKDKSDDPTQEQPDTTVTYEPYEEPFVKDSQGTNVVNSAGDSFTPPPTHQKVLTVLTCKKNYAAGFDPITAADQIGCVNNDTFLGKPPLTWRLADRKPVLKMKNGIQYWECTNIIKYKKNKWSRDILDEGYNFIDPNDHVKKPILIKGVQCKWLLNGAGGLQDPGVGGEKYITFFPDDEISFNSLNLGFN